MNKLVSGFWLLLAIAVLSIRPAYAYLDPGAASMVLQGIIGGIAAAGAVVSMNYQRLKRRVRVWRGKDVDPDRK